MTTTICVSCEEPFEQIGRGRAAKRCRLCRPNRWNAYVPKSVACAECGQQTTDLETHANRLHKAPSPANPARPPKNVYTFLCPCGDEFSRYTWSSGKRPIYCSKACAGKGTSARRMAERQFRICEICCGEFRCQPASPQKYCGYACSSQRNTSPTTPCERCGTPVKQIASRIAKQGPARFCSRDCMNPNPARIAKGYVTRATFYGVEYDPTVKRAGVLARDNWVCKLCDGPIIDVPYSRHDYNSDYGTVDHILPMSKGGAHVWSNVQAAHHRCNSIKGTRAESAFADPDRGIAAARVER